MPNPLIHLNAVEYAIEAIKVSLADVDSCTLAETCILTSTSLIPARLDNGWHPDVQGRRVGSREADTITFARV